MRIRIKAIRNAASAANADNERERITLAFTLFTALTLVGGVFPLRVLFFA
jgi:hypothetical protein